MELSKKLPKINGSKLKISIVLPYFNDKLGAKLYANVKKELLKNGVTEKNIRLVRVAGALETPFACKQIINKQKPDVIIALGVIIKGETSHYDLVCDITYKGLMQVQLGNNLPIIFGILTCTNLKQAEKRIDTKGLNKGAYIAEAALIQGTLNKTL